ncbi:hypothetical protein [Alloactinosynnema sp. L-07]|nr:hypothetical protein [Alloactinosynnema sp. L-07]
MLRNWTTVARVAKRLDRAAWMLGERVPSWLWAIVPAAWMLAFPSMLTAAVLVAWFGFVVTVSHALTERELVAMADRWAHAAESGGEVR